MKKIVASVGLAALVAVSVQAVYGQAEPYKSWSLSASLRGFYDDNINTVPSGAGPVESLGYEISPTFSFNLPFEQTDITFFYTYSFKYYENPAPQYQGKDHQSHTLGLLLNHAFSQQVRMSIQDQFIVGQEPDLLRGPSGVAYSPQYINGNNFHNYGSITLNVNITPQFGLEAGYANTLYDYEDDFWDVLYGLNGPAAVMTSYSGLLDRIDHAIRLEGRWRLQPETVGLVGYTFAISGYTGDQPIGAIINTPPVLNDLVMSEDRNSYAHYGYVGAEHVFRPDLFGMIKAGARFTDYYNSPDASTSIGPYVSGNLRYTYTKESTAEIGLSYDQSATDLFTVDGDSITTDANTFLVYGSVIHRIAPRLFGTVIGTFQYSTYNGGTVDNEAEQFFVLGLNLEYRFNYHFSAHAGYNYDLLCSDVNRGYDRNRVYLGVTATY